MQRRYVTVDVFTDRAFGGNPLAVVLDAGGLSAAQMQAIACEFNYAETTFVLPPGDAAHDAQVRIFTVRSEIPFAGHPNVGTAFVLATRAAQPPERLLFEEKAGLVPVAILKQAREIVGAELTAPQPLQRLKSFSAAQAAACLSLSAADVRVDRHSPQIIWVGLPFLAVELGTREALRRARPDADRVRAGLSLRRLRCGLPLHARRARRRAAVRPAGADVSSGIERPVGSRHRQRHRRRRGAGSPISPASAMPSCRCQSDRASTSDGQACC